MKIAWVSSWPPRPCGIATYSLELVDALRKKGGDVYIVCHTDGGKPGEKDVYPVINLDEVDWAEKLYSIVGEIKPDIVHIQHEYGLYSVNGDYSAGLLRPLFRWKLDDSFPVVITYHSVYSKMDRARAMFMDLMQRLVHAGIVH
ncbi:glycosyltransferase, partial [Candidatus Aerophobetes bacterium]|nr:glycosyltransferase [Candidatus Aerophobetes bacterium]